MIRRIFNKEFVRFVIVGIFATILHYAIYYALIGFIDVNVAYLTGYILSFIANFYLTSYFTFGVSPSWHRLIGMSGAHAVNLILHMVLLNFFIYISVPKEWAPLPVYAIAVPVNFILVRFVFKYKKKNVI